MLNCIPQGPFFGINPRIIDAREDDEELEEYLRSRYSADEKQTSKAHEMEDVLTNALSMAERNSGSLLWYQQTSKNNAIEMGRSISKLEISKVRSMEELPPPPGAETLTSANSFQRTPTFLKIEKGDPYILTQKSWETINPTTDDEDSYDDDTAEYDEDDDVSFRNVDGTVIRGIHKDQEENSAGPNSRSRSWNKLRKSIVRDERTASSPKRRFGGIGSSIRKIRGGSSPRTQDNEGPELQRSLSFAKNSDVEVALSPEKKRRNWAPKLRRVRRGNKKVQGLQETPRDVTADEEEEGFFVNSNGIDARIEQQDDLVLEKEPVLTEEMSIEEAQSMEIACGFDACSTVDIIGSTLFLKGGDSLFDLNRQDMNEDSFDIVPRRQ